MKKWMKHTDNSDCRDLQHLVCFIAGNAANCCKRAWMFMLLAFLFAFPVLGQHQPIISQYMLNKFLFNPALTGLKDQTTITAGYRKQWAAIEGAPVSYYLTGHTPLGGEAGQSHTGLGGTLFSDNIGPLRTTTLSVSGAYHTPVSRQVHISAGIGLGVAQRYLDMAALSPEMANDPALAMGTVNQLRPFVSAGLWAFSSHFFAGISTIQAPAQDIHSGLYDQIVSVRHYFMNAGIMLRLNQNNMGSYEKSFLLIPSTIIRYLPAASLVYDLNVRLVYNNTLMVGASYRSSKDVVFQLGAELAAKRSKHRDKTPPAYFFSYAYDMGYSELGQVSAGTHEITIGVRLFKDKVRCPLVKTIPIYFF